MLPLLNPDTPSTFTRDHRGRHMEGAVFSQYQNQHRKHLMHPHVFYVEFPANNGGGPVHEVSARKLAAIIGDGGTNRSFTRLELARSLERLPADLELIQLLPRLAP